MENERLQELIQSLSGEILAEMSGDMLAEIAIKNNAPGAFVSPYRYLHMPCSDFVRLSKLTGLESVSQFKAAVVSATSLLKFKQNSSYYPEYSLPSIFTGD
jgi:hypothetical protein